MRVKDADIVLLGVKPQNVEAVLRPLSEEVDKLGPLKVTFFFFTIFLHGNFFLCKLGSLKVTLFFPLILVFGNIFPLMNSAP